MPSSTLKATQIGFLMSMQCMSGLATAAWGLLYTSREKALICYCSAGFKVKNFGNQKDGTRAEGAGQVGSTDWRGRQPQDWAF